MLLYDDSGLVISASTTCSHWAFDAKGLYAFSKSGSRRHLVYGTLCL